MLDPSTKKLFAMLPAPKQSQVSLSTVYRDTAAKVAIINNSPDSSSSEREQEPETGVQIDRSEFYRNQVKKHSLEQFRRQTLARMKGDMGDLAAKGKGKNQLASLATEHLDRLTQLQDEKSTDLDQFRQKRARYGW